MDYETDNEGNAGEEFVDDATSSMTNNDATSSGGAELGEGNVSDIGEPVEGEKSSSAGISSSDEETGLDGASKGSVEASGGKSWRDGLSDESLKANKSLAKFNDVESLAKSYLELSKKLGSKGLMPLPKNATAEQVAARRALKRGEGINSIDDYQWRPDAELAGGLNQLKQTYDSTPLANALFEAGADADTFKSVMDAMGRAEIAKQRKMDSDLAKCEELLRDEWNEDYDVNAKAVEMFVSKRFPEVHQTCKQFGLYKAPAVAKMFLKMNEMTSDGEIRIQKAASKSFDERLKAIEKSEAYRNEWHPDHKKARSAWADLIMEQANQRGR